ncbi:MAG TPA: hypothetical protein ENK18_07945 [Deltaproteobacteria bacterium]|nr:hypothetical protein [Deltaproteobacteria bacterium]
MIQPLVWLLACAGAPAIPGLSAPDGTVCPAGAEPLVLEPERPDPARWLPGTEVRLCRTAAGTNVGPHEERWPGSGRAVEGRWGEAGREGTWLSFFPDGAFRSRIDYAGGVPHGLRRELSADGRVVELQLEHGTTVGLRSLPRQTPMPEWSSGARSEGTRHLEHAGPEPRDEGEGQDEDE